MLPPRVYGLNCVLINSILFKLVEVISTTLFKGRSHLLDKFVKQAQISNYIKRFD